MITECLCSSCGDCPIHEEDWDERAIARGGRNTKPGEWCDLCKSFDCIYPWKSYPPAQPKAPTIFDEAKEIVLGDRREAYDHPERNLGQTGDMWTAYLMRKLKPGERVDARDVGWMNTLQKGSRDSFKRKHDNLVDGIGYLGCASMSEEGK